MILISKSSHISQSYYYSYNFHFHFHFYFFLLLQMLLFLYFIISLFFFFPFFFIFFLVLLLLFFFFFFFLSLFSSLLYVFSYLSSYSNFPSFLLCCRTYRNSVLQVSDDVIHDNQLFAETDSTITL